MNWLTGAIAAARNLHPFKLVRRNLELETENAEVRRENLALRDKVRKAESTLKQRSEMSLSSSGYYTQGRDSTAYCATCFQTKETLVSLEPPERWNGGVRRNCPACGRSYWDQPQKPAEATFYSPRMAWRAFRSQ
jgi:hypothetical protein